MKNYQKQLATVGLFVGAQTSPFFLSPKA